MRKDLMLVAVIVATLTLMVVPLTQAAIDVLLAVNISLSVLLLMVALYLRRPSDFSTFPSVILIGTAFRLALSVGTTRLILSEADAGRIIETFGEFVVGGSIAIGLVIFLIITVVQFLVVTKGAERVAEVAARFALDAMPGKQLSIDAEVRAGTIDAEEAARLRRRLDRDSQFFGAMDGAMKFVKGDAIAGIVIIVINLLGGIAVGMTTHGLTFGEAAGVFSLLTVGDGLVAQIPALLMSLCAGVVVTRVADGGNLDLGSDISAELVSDARVPSLAAAIVLAIGFIPGFPLTVFAGIAVVLLIIASILRRAARAAAAEHDAASEEPEAAGPPPAPVSRRFRLLLGPALAAGVDLETLEARLEERFAALHAARGVPFPRAGLEVSPALEPHGAVVELDEVPIFRARVPEGALAVPGGAELAALLPDAEGIAWPSLRGRWAPAESAGALAELALDAVPREDALASLAFRLFERNLGTLFTHAVCEAFLDEVRAAEPATMALIEEESTAPALYKTLRYLVEDGVPLRPLPLLAASIHYWLHASENPTSLSLAECLRGSMRRQLCHRIAGPEGVLGVILLDPQLETLARRGLGDGKRTGSTPGDGLSFAPEIGDALLARFRALAADAEDGSRGIAVIASADLRRRLRNFLAANGVTLPVLAPHEIAPEATTLPVELLRVPEPAAAPASAPASDRAPARPPPRRPRRASAAAV